jgi:hypothetical protein
MMKTKRIIAGSLVLGGLLAMAVPASADWGHQRELLNDRRDIRGARRELRHDLRGGASPAEIAQDRAAIARERHDLWEDRRDWRYGYGYGYDDYRYQPRGWWDNGWWWRR